MTLADRWQSYWRDCEAGGSRERDRRAARDAWLAGAAAMFMRIREAGPRPADRELRAGATAEVLSDLGPTVGLAKLPPPPAGYAAS